MKKFLSCLLILSIILSSSFAFASGMEVQPLNVIGEDPTYVSLDDFKVGDSVTIDDWGIIKFASSEVQDAIGYYKAGAYELSYNRGTWDWINRSGNEADYLFVFFDITNLSVKEKNFLENVSVKIVYNEKYEYGGWVHQRNYNNGTSSSCGIEADANKQNKRWSIDKSNWFPIEPMYEGHYTFGCTLPNAVLGGTGSIVMIITIDGNEITYNYRK